MSNELLEKVLLKLEEIDKKFDNIATKDDINSLNNEIVHLRHTISEQHIENLNSDNFILKSLDEIKESVRFVNHRVADAELELNNIKKIKQ